MTLLPFSDLEKIQDEMNKLFNFSLARWPQREVSLLEKAWFPAIDLYDLKDNILVKADLPGMTKDDIDISIQDNLLVIKGEKKQKKEVKEGNLIKTERFYGTFNRTVSLPAEIDLDKVSATYKEGVLELNLPKKEESKPKQISVKVN